MTNAHLGSPERLALLRLLDLLRPHADSSFDRVTAIAAAVTGSPIALLTFVGPDGQWLGSHHGLAATWQPLSRSLCVYTVDDGQPLEIFDAASEPQFKNHALVAEGVRFYAGYPVVFDNQVLGTVCVLDHKPRQLEPAQAITLAHLARLVVDLLQVRLERSRAVQAEADRRETEERLRRSQRLESIGVLAGGIAHDFNNIIGGILGHVDLALQDAMNSEKPLASTQSLEQIRKAGLRGRDMVQQILAFAKRRPAARGPCDVRELVDETLALLRPMAPPRVALVSSASDQVLLVSADATQLEQALINLCVNAWQAMRGAPGRIEIEARQVQVDKPTSEALELEPGHYVRIEVRDNGPGMDQSTAAHAFEAFFTTKSDGQGTGLGLAMVHGIAKRHGGAVTLVTAPGQGARFGLWLPAGHNSLQSPPTPGGGGVALAAQPPADGAATVNAAVSTNLRDGAVEPMVIYVDDDDVMRALVPDILARRGYRVASHASGEEALEAVLRSPEAVAVVITDLNMPGMSGLELMQVLRTGLPHLPVIIATGELSAEVAAELRAAGATQMYGKEYVAEELPALLDNVLARMPRPSPG